MPSNNTGSVVKELIREYPEKIALLLHPDRVYDSLFMGQYAIDNGAFKKFDERKFFYLLDYARKFHKPLFVTCPDVVGCHDRTLALWHHYYSRLVPYGYPIAFVAQDGCTLDAVPRECNWIFIGGTNDWKPHNIRPYIGIKPVHVGRVNSMNFLETCEQLGVASIDGTGWMRARDKKYYGFLSYLKGEQLGLPTSKESVLQMQCNFQ